MNELPNRLEEVPVARIRVDGGTQIRTSTYFDKIAEYAEAMTNGVNFPALTVYFDGEDYWLADGFHRLSAHKAVGDALGVTHLHVLCEVVDGSQAAAILCACGANAEHGIQRTPEDKRAAVDTVLKNPLVSINPNTGEPWAAAEIARQCNVGETLVRKRISLVAVPRAGNSISYEKDGQTVSRVARNGKRSAGVSESDQTARPNENAAFDGTKWTPISERQPAGAAAPFKQSTEWDHLYTLLKQVDEAVKALPAPDVAAANFPISLAHALPLQRVTEVKKWWLDFTRFWEARDPEIQRHRQEVRDFIKENMNVAAE